VPEMGLGGGGSVMKDREGSRQRCRQTSPSSCRWVRGGLTYAHRTCFSSWTAETTHCSPRAGPSK